ncbi:hypothetical protein SteCoe_29226 [Stentor coeruleus]|uniref:Signal recognition particle 14 kDa protein n=1 Tax=Stentor coeruleus TaxID=5963 RepID=A0A1R2B6H0_9CILI|nr:hypothetical protein SteCoe_29226 [Stentor coeruleus]
MLLDYQDFLKKLEEAFAETKDKGSVWVWFKQCPEWVGKHRTGKDREERRNLQVQQNLESHPFTLVVRMKTKKRRFTTKVPAEESAYFQRLLHNILLVNYPKKN